MRPITLTPSSFKAALALGIGLAALGGWSAASAQDAPPAPAAPPGPATQPPPPPGTAQPAPTQPQAPPTPPGTTTAPGAPAAPAATPPPNYNLQYNGLVDGYYLFNFRNPKNISAGAGPLYDIRHNSPALSLGELNVFKNAAPGGLGFKATLDIGDTADINAGGLGVTTGEGRYKNLGQLYATYAFGADGSGVDFGKFFTPFGYEVTESNGNYNYSRSTAYNYVPFYHAGARIYAPVPSVAGLTATFYLVNAVFNSTVAGVEDDNKKPGYMGQLNYTAPNGKFVLISELGLGKDKIFADASGNANQVDTKVLVNDNNFTYNFNANQLAGVDYGYRRFNPNGGGKETTNFYAVYYRQALTAKTAAALRFSGAEDKYSDELGGGTIRPYDITATYELKPAANFLTRLEYRHDHNNVASFVSGSSDPGAGLKKDQDTVSVSGVFTF